jgi:hypothetical protein
MSELPQPSADELTIYSMAWELSEKEDEIADLKAKLKIRAGAQNAPARTAKTTSLAISRAAAKQQRKGIV